jgi:hypothetical protein
MDFRPFRRCGGRAFEASTLIPLEGICNAPGDGRWMEALSAPEPDDESLIDTASNYRHPESSAETEHRYEKSKMSGITDEVQ